MSDVTIYTAPNCGPCMGVKRYLQSNSIKYEEKDARQNVEYLQSLGAMSAPVLVSGDAVVMGFDLENLKRVFEFGKLP